MTAKPASTPPSWLKVRSALGTKFVCSIDGCLVPARSKKGESLGPAATIQTLDEASKPENVHFGEIHWTTSRYSAVPTPLTGDTTKGSRIARCHARHFPTAYSAWSALPVRP